MLLHFLLFCKDSPKKWVFMQLCIEAECSFSPILLKIRIDRMFIQFRRDFYGLLLVEKPVDCVHNLLHTQPECWEYLWRTKLNSKLFHISCKSSVADAGKIPALLIH